MSGAFVLGFVACAVVIFATIGAVELMLRLVDWWRGPEVK